MGRRPLVHFRRVEAGERAFARGQLDKTFYEGDSAWEYIEDDAGSTYWTNKEVLVSSAQCQKNDLLFLWSWRLRERWPHWQQ